MSLEELWRLFPIILREANPDYTVWYGEEEEALLRSLREYDVCRISHIGSTSVDGLIAKPIVDILLELPQQYDMVSITQILQQNDWILMHKDYSAETLDLNKGYTPAGFAEKVFHLHVKPSGDWDELYFRDYLREHPETARQYGTLKQSLLQQFEYNRDAYTDAKSEFVLETTKKARFVYGLRYFPIPY